MEVVFLPNTFHEIEQTEFFRLRRVFNAGQSAVSASLNTENRLVELNEITIGSRQVVSITLVPGYINLILPLVNELLIEQEGFINLLEPGQVLNVSVDTDSVLKIKNDSIQESSLFIQIIFKDYSNNVGLLVYHIGIDHPNQQLHSIKISPECTITMGKFLGRFDYSFDNEKNEQIVAYVISGVFEVEHRLMEAGDIIMFYGMEKNQIEFESLSVESILLILKFKK